eukprot:GHVN01011484.1.p1 GENE.GHVN01011484.1~~GHVN01011484.1.p1  ORF type:complete len:280 (-),score=57.11 GHVN01011484.1:78-917(-)
MSRRSVKPPDSFNQTNDPHCLNTHNKTLPPRSTHPPSTPPATSPPAPSPSSNPWCPPTSPSDIEYTLLSIDNVFVYKTPPRPPRGHRAESWASAIWNGQLSVIGQGNRCTIKLRDTNTGELYAQCPLPPCHDQAVENAIDSSRYFVLRLDDGKGKHAFVGVGFDTRNEAFDFKSALSDFSRHLAIEQAAAAKPPLLPLDQQQSQYQLKEGETISLKLPPQKLSRIGPRSDHSGGRSAQATQGGGGSSQFISPPLDSSQIISPPPDSSQFISPPPATESK